MSPRPSHRDALLDAFVELVADDGERTATLDAVAERAGVSKGGLLYHFPSRDSLVEGLVDRVRTAAAADLEVMRQHPEGAAAYHLRTSVPGASSDDELDRLVTAATHLATSGRHPRVADALRATQEDWYAAVLEDVRDPAVARVVTLVADGLWFTPRDLAPGDGDPRSATDVDELVAVLTSLAPPRTDGAEAART